LDQEEALAEEQRTANAIYGVIVSSAVMASAHAEAVGRLAVAVVVTLTIYWAAERYAHLMANHIGLGPHVRWRDLREGLRGGWDLVTASFLPLLVLLVGGALGASYVAAVVLALFTSTGLLTLAGWRVGREVGLGAWQSLLSAVGAGAFGVAMIALKSLLH